MASTSESKGKRRWQMLLLLAAVFLDLDVQTGGYRSAMVMCSEGRPTASSSDDLWKDLLDSPQDWRDYRNLKDARIARARFPDFKKEGEEKSLWLTDLSEMHSERFQYRDQQSDPRPWKQPKANRGMHICLWMEVLTRPKEWKDMRSEASFGSRRPDFRHVQEALPSLYLDSCPAALRTRIERIDREMKESKKQHWWSGPPLDFMSLWESILQDFRDWIDFRTLKRDGKVPADHADFQFAADPDISVHIDENTPKWAIEALKEDATLGEDARQWRQPQEGVVDAAEATDAEDDVDAEEDMERQEIRQHDDEAWEKRSEEEMIIEYA